MSTSFYKRKVVPHLLKVFRTTRPSTSSPTTCTVTQRQRDHSVVNVTRSVEVWSTTCIVTNFGGGGETAVSHDTNHKNGDNDVHVDEEELSQTAHPNCSILINPSNPQLSGVQNFPYFPKGGPVPAAEVKSFSSKNWQPLGKRASSRGNNKVEPYPKDFIISLTCSSFLAHVLIPFDAQRIRDKLGWNGSRGWNDVRGVCSGRSRSSSWWFAFETNHPNVARPCFARRKMSRGTCRENSLFWSKRHYLSRRNYPYDSSLL
jgi:hypothetical protein